MMKIAKIFFSENELEVADKLQQSGLKSVQVVGRGTVIAKASDIAKANSFADNVHRAKKIVDRDMARTPA